MQRAWITALFCSILFLGPLSAQHQTLVTEDFLKLSQSFDPSKKNLSHEEQIFLKAVSFYKQRKWSFCIELLQSLKQNKNFILRDYVYFLLGSSYYQRGSYQLAYEYLNKLKITYPQFVLKSEINGILADSLLYLKKYREAAPLFLKDYYQETHKWPRESALLAAAFSYEKASSAQEALALYKMFWKKYPQHPSSSFVGEKVENLGGRLSPDDWYAHFLHYADMGARLEKLKTLYNTLPDHKFEALKSRIFYQMGRSYELLQNDSEAQKTYSAFYEKYHSPYALHRLARLAYKSGDVKTAIDYHLRVARDYSNIRLGEEALYLAAFLNLEEALYEQSRNLFLKHLKKYPRSKRRESVMWYIGWSFYLENKHDEAISVLRAFLEKYKKSVHREKILYWVGKMLIEKGEKNESQKYFYALIKENPWNYYSLLTRKNKFLEKEPELLLFSLPVPQNKEVRATDIALKAMTLKKLGLRGWAAQELNRVVLSNLRNKELLIHLAQTLVSIEDYFRAHSLAEVYFPSIFNTARGPENRFLWELAFPRAYQDRVEKVSQDFDLDPHLIYALMKAESNFRPRIISAAHAYGLMQIIPATAEHIAQELQTQNFTIQGLFDPFLNIKFGSWYFKHLLAQFENNSLLAIPSYNAGPHRTVEWIKKFNALDRDKFIEQIPFKETRDYVKKVLKYYYIYQDLYNT